MLGFSGRRQRTIEASKINAKSSNYGLLQRNPGLTQERWTPCNANSRVPDPEGLRGPWGIHSPRDRRHEKTEKRVVPSPCDPVVLSVVVPPTHRKDSQEGREGCQETGDLDDVLMAHKHQEQGAGKHDGQAGDEDE